MDMLSMCRICLIQDTKMNAIVGTKLEKLYEKLTTIPFQARDNRPSKICYICYARLRNCYHLQMNCFKSEKLLSEILTNNKSKSTLLENFNSFKIVHPRIHLSCIPVSLMEPDDKDDHDEQIHEDYDAKKVISDVHVKEEVAEEAQDNIIDYTENIKYTKPETTVKIERDDTENDDDSNCSIHIEEAEDMEENVIKEEPATELEDELLIKDIDEVNTNSSQLNHITSIGSNVNKFLKPKFMLNREDLDCVDSSASAMKGEVETSVGCKFSHSTSFHYKTEEIKKPEEEKVTTKENIVKNYMHITERPYMCKVCNKCFGRKAHLTEHKRIHTGERPYKCDECDKCFMHSGSLKQHKRSIHRDIKDNVGDKDGNESKSIDLVDNPYRCEVCHKTYKHKNGLNRHIRIHTNEKPYICDICNKGFTVKECLKNHIRIHFDQKLYKCNVCDKSFKIKSTLRFHSLIHTRVRQFKCNICDKSFTLNGDLTRHMRIHTGEKPFKCDICDKGFKRHSDVVGHRRIHTGERPFKCDLCDKRFTVKTGLNAHRRTHRCDCEKKR